MANNNRREIELALSITTANADALTKLQQDVRGLAKEGGDAAPAFQKLADELGQLAEQAKQLTALEGLTQELKAAATAQVDAASKSTALKQTLDQLVAATDAAREAERAKNLELSNAKRAVQEAQDAISKLKNDTSDAGKNTAGYTIKLVELKGALLDARAAKRDLTAQLDALNVKTQDAASAVKDQGKAYKDAAKDTTDATTAMRGLQAQVDGVTEKYRTAGGAADDLANAQRNLGTAAAGVRAAIQGVIADQERLAQAERDAANEALRQSAIIADTKRKQAAQAKAEADGIIADYQRMERAQQDAARSAKAAGDAISNAFGTVGQRSAQEIRQEIERVQAAMRLLASSGAATGTELATAMQRGETAVNGLQRELREVTGALTMADRAANLFKGSMGQIAAGNLVADAVGALVEKVKDLGRAFVASVVQLDQFRRGMNAIYKDAGVAAQQLDFLRSTANESGVAFGSLSESFVRFSAATKSAGIPLGVTNDLFASVTKSAGSLGLTTEQTSGALDALGQIASKGVVSLEELRQQLGDRMPGALSAAARGLGITEAELIKLVESGNLAARDFFPAFSRGLKGLQGDTEGLLPSWNRLTNVFKEAGQSAGDAGWTQVMAAGLKSLAVVTGAVLIPLQTLFELIGGTAKSLGILTAAITSVTNPMDALREVWGSAGDRLESLNSAVLGAIGFTDQNAAAQKKLAVETTAATQTTVAAKEAVDLLAVARKLDADATLDQAAKLVQFNVQALAALKTQELRTEAAEKSAKATKVEGDSLVSLIALRGDEQAKLLASQTAAENYADAIGKAAQEQAKETDILKLQLERLALSTGGRAEDVEAMKVQRQALEDKIKTSEAETEQANQSAEAARRETLARQIAAETYRDNSAKIDEYRTALVAAQRELEATIEFEKRGVLSKKDAEAAQERLTVAQAKYNDALGDSARRQQAYVDSARAVNQEAEAGLRLSLAIAQAAERKARLDGDEYSARQAQIKQREIELELYKLKIKSMQLEAQGSIDLANATLAEKIAKGEVSAVDQIRITTSIRLAEVKLLEAKALGVNVEAMERELNTLRSGISARETNTRALGGEIRARGQAASATNAHSDALEKLNMRYMNSADYTERQIALLEREAAATEKAAEAYRKKWNVDKDGFSTNSSGQREQQWVWTRATIIEYLEQAGLDKLLAEDLAKQFVQPNGTVNYEASAAQLKWGGKNSTLSEALGKMTDYYKFGDGKHEAQQRTAALNGAAAPGTPRTPTAAAPTAAAGVTMNFTLSDGTREQVRVKDDASATALQNVLRGLGAAATRAS